MLEFGYPCRSGAGDYGDGAGTYWLVALVSRLLHTYYLPEVGRYISSKADDANMGTGDGCGSLGIFVEGKPQFTAAEVSTKPH